MRHLIEDAIGAAALIVTAYIVMLFVFNI